jgi:hypothetical protein
LFSAEQSATTETADAATLLVPAVDGVVLLGVEEVRPSRHRSKKRSRLIRRLRQVGGFRTVKVKLLLKDHFNTFILFLIVIYSN